MLRNTDPIGPATQPTWSRDGSRAVSYIPSADGGSVVVASLDEEWSAEARRSYFFFSWSGDGQYIAALGPGPQGTTLDILTPEGELATEGSIDTASFYLAWEPGGADAGCQEPRRGGRCPKCQRRPSGVGRWWIPPWWRLIDCSCTDKGLLPNSI